MTILIPRKYFDNEKFVIFVIECIQRDIIKCLDIKQLRRCDNYLKKNFPTVITCKNILISYSQQLCYSTSEKAFIIHSNNESYLYGTNYKINSLAKLINYGNLQLKPYNILSTIFSMYQKNLCTLWKAFKHFNQEAQ